MRFHALLVACAAAVSGCASTGSGGVMTASLPSETAPNEAGAEAILDALGDGLIGGAVGASLEGRDRRRALQAEYRALEHTPSGQPVVWRTSDPALYGEVVAAQPYRVGSQDCRQYKHTVHVGGEERVARGAACRNPDGSWTPLT